MANFNHFPAIAAALRTKARHLVEQTTRAVEADAKVRAPVDTGFLRSSIQSEMTGETEGTVTVGADYGAYVEFGTRYTYNQPYFIPAFDQQRPAFEAGLDGLLD